ncbi:MULTISPECIES: heavy-metal-associated domain-containing protein [unclassified Olleya]|jgi:copper chaperone|uniref:heavy-metal-associated domain-containing protein n=1 Tax=unclassified Olleya TaxID=2615019 RepID=UPI00119DBD22|nr:heavy-metal-associated domain-containing protein [Olleya sp. Hel_I_94]TVZ49922.1 copper chaperone [Olleya sp. Hel_I_94]|tara:strand:- start:167 stop:379 length:213 start_codon:yes stop_codon:yes gene_type:complete
MKTLKFKTNINCGGCISKVTPFLNKQEGVESWEVDTANADKILTIESNGATEEDVKATLQKIGFKAELVN